MPPDEDNPPEKKGVWRPFQLAFLLMNLHSLAQPEDASRSVVDLIWFPTGGGKTEAYLGLAAYAIILRRLLNPNDGGTAVLMRYTLRLLTAQQFQRAASLICALELLRRAGEIPGQTPISIGLWAGGALTPNTRDDAKKQFEKFVSEGRKNPFVLLNCPWCGAPMGAIKPEITAPDGSRETAFDHQVVGYKTDFSHPNRSGPKTVIFQCRDETCEFSYPHRLPVCVIDEDLFDAPPTLLLGTVDKFAMLAWKPEARAFFGRSDQAENKHAPPDLIIQDELHLISGALGSTVGHYETVIQELCSRGGNAQGARIGPKIVASTATVSHAKEQCHALWNCGKQNVFQFPPQCLEAGDSFFAFEDKDAPGRKYVGVFAQAATSPLSALVRAFAALLQAPRMAKVLDEKDRDPYWTLVGYFNSLRELGHTATLVRAEVSEHLERIHRRLMLPYEEGTKNKRRWARTCMELTSRIASDKITESLQRLFLNYPQEGRDFPEDVCLATNMISVGVDVPRLGMMTVSGQPKTTAEYIQATSRVGREHPGLVVMIYNEKRARDRSHFEHFHSYHSAVYKHVEPTSVTPFSSPVRDRALHALLTIWMRMNGGTQLRKEPRLLPDSQSQGEFETLKNEVESLIERRVRTVDQGEMAATMSELRELILRWKNLSANRYGKPDYDNDNSAPLLYRAGLPPNPSWGDGPRATMTSMRGVDATCNVRVLNAPYPQPPVTGEEEQGASDVSF
jgi:hypothetical protein